MPVLPAPFGSAASAVAPHASDAGLAFLGTRPVHRGEAKDPPAFVAGMLRFARESRSLLRRSTLEGVADSHDRAVDEGTKSGQGNDRDHGNEDQDEGVFDQPLSFLAVLQPALQTKIHSQHASHSLCRCCRLLLAPQLLR